MSLIKIDLKNYIKQLKLFKINNFKFLVLMNNLNKLLYFQIENNYAILKKKELLYFKILMDFSCCRSFMLQINKNY